MSEITGKTRLLGVIGHPIGHSLSPLMHNAALTELRENYVYVAFPIKPEDLATAIAGLESIGVVGFSVTIPHKQTIMPFLSQITPTAKLVGAVNTVWWTEQGWQGTNTDVEGFVAPLTGLDRDWRKVKPVVLGNGGAARAVVVGLAQLGCPEIQIVGRNLEKLAAFKNSWSRADFNSELSVYPWQALAELIPSTTLLINTTPLGMTPHLEQSPVEEALMQGLSSSAIAYDLIYTPRPTRFLQQAADQGATIIDGLEMLVQQGAAALRLWLRKPVPVDTMRQALKDFIP
ncbi:MAG: shikimate dehydrogenase [Snowella sp.]|nr:shikimate dehydrogenase [Snowella sp.]